jgi:Mrp family chromosome partitioning ATPase
MSKNFELLRRAGWRQDYFEGLPGASAPMPETARRDTSRKTRTCLSDDPVSSIVRKVFLETRGEPIRIVSFAGISRRAGCTWTCVHVAKTLANYVDGRVCLVDANFEAPAVHKYFSGGDCSGLSDALCGDKPAKNYVVTTSRANVWYLPAGNKCQRVEMFLGGSQLDTHLQGLANEFAHVLIDAPSLDSGALVTTICKAGEGTVLVMEPSGVTAAALARGRGLLTTARVPLLGVVLNQRVPTLPPVLDRLTR